MIAQPVLGRDDAPIKIVSLMDFQCPSCAYHHPNLVQVVTARPNDVQLLYVHLPLPYHEHAVAAANAAECAGDVGAFREWTHVVFSQQDSLGIKDWSAFAREAGIADTLRIASCAAESMPSFRVAKGLEYAEAVGATGTPTVLINGWRYQMPPSVAKLEADIETLLEEGTL